MQKTRLIELILSVIALASPCLAQGGDVAIIDTKAFAHKVGGIIRLARAQKSVEAELQPCLDELNRLQRQASRLDAPAVPIPVYPSDLEDRRERASSLRLLIERRRAQCQASYDRRTQEMFGPVAADIQKRLEEFAKRRQVKLLIDKSRTECAMPCHWETLADRDVTEEFIREYNRLNP